ncbi:MAG: DinB family protein [Cytophagaceae bacterium]|nr:DinB family protein [Gemmatimonadaceae bacterium]
MPLTAAPRSTRPEPTEHSPYYGTYIAHVPDGDVVDALAREADGILPLLRALPESLGGKRYAEGKWSIREVVGHITDTERVFAYRAMRFARKDETELPGFDENAFVASGSFDSRTLASLCEEFQAVRAATVCLFRSLTPEEWVRQGTANRARMSVRAFAWITAGHELHHVGVLKSRYL